MGLKKLERKRFIYKTVTLLLFFYIIYFLHSNSNTEMYLIDKTTVPSTSTVLSSPAIQTIKNIKFSSVFRDNSCQEAVFLSMKIQPPKLAEDKFTESLVFVKEQLALNKYHLASNHISTIVQEQIRQIQGMDCDQPNLQCGHQDSCGFGCQIHHRIACLMMSYTTKLPLIHTPDCDRWPFSDRWTDIFQPLGSSCVPGNNTIVWKWTDQFHYGCYHTNFTKTILYPLTYGVPLDSKLGYLIETISPEPFRWIVGQFAKYAIKLNSTFARKLSKWKTEIGFDNNKTPIVGIQVRVTDKFLEAEDSWHPISVYMEEVEKYFQEFESSRGLVNNSLQRIVYLASDNSSILADAVKMYPNWNIMGYPSKFSETFAGRRDGLADIVRDIEFLAQADFVVCGLSSNICRLIYEMQAAEEDNGKNENGQPKIRLKSLDGFYNYLLLYHGLSPKHNMKIWKVDC